MTTPSTDSLPGKISLTSPEARQSEANRIIRKALAQLDWLSIDAHEMLTAELRATLGHDDSVARAMRRGVQRCAAWQDNLQPATMKVRRMIAAAIISVIQTANPDRLNRGRWRTGGKRLRNIALHRHANLILGARYHRVADEERIAGFLHLSQSDAQRLHNDALDVTFNALCEPSTDESGIRRRLT